MWRCLSRYVHAKPPLPDPRNTRLGRMGLVARAKALGGTIRLPEDWVAWIESPTVTECWTYIKP